MILVLQNPGLHRMSFSVDGDLVDRWCQFWVWAVGVQDKRKHLLGPSGLGQAPVNSISKRKDYSLWKTCF